mgnify:CR=1 FL=1
MGRQRGRADSETPRDRRKHQTGGPSRMVHRRMDRPGRTGDEDAGRRWGRRRPRRRIVRPVRRVRERDHRIHRRVRPGRWDQRERCEPIRRIRGHRPCRKRRAHVLPARLVRRRGSGPRRPQGHCEGTHANEGGYLRQSGLLGLLRHDTFHVRRGVRREGTRTRGKQRAANRVRIAVLRPRHAGRRREPPGR